MANARYKLSRYIVKSEPIIKNAYRVLYSTRTAEVILIKDTNYKKLETQDFETLGDDLLIRLAQARIVVPYDEDELSRIINDNRVAIAEDTVLYTAVAPSADCQLGCDYCGQSHTKTKMNLSVHNDVLARIEKKLTNNSGFKHLAIAWFGAEPLTGLKSIYAMSERLVEMAERYGCTYGSEIVTNGLALTNEVFYKLVDKCLIKDFEITLDGSEKYHDARRFTKKGHASYGLIMRNLTSIIHDPRFAEVDVKLTIRCNVDGRNHVGTRDLIDDMEEKGILDKVVFYMAPIHSWGNSAHLGALSHQSYADFEIDIFTNLIKRQSNIAVLPKKVRKIVCMSLKKDAELIDAYGDIYNCSEISQVAAYKEVKLYKLDRLDNKGAPLLENRPFSDWNEEILAGKVPCHDCRILPICGGACPKLWKEGISPCPSIKENLEQRLLLHVVKMKDQGKLTIS